MKPGSPGFFSIRFAREYGGVAGFRPTGMQSNSELAIHGIVARIRGITSVFGSGAPADDEHTARHVRASKRGLLAGWIGCLLLLVRTLAF